MKIALAQTLFRLGDFDNNYDILLQNLKNAIQQKVDILVFPEGGLWGYSAQDFLYHKDFYKIQDKKIQLLKKKLPESLNVLLPGFRYSKKKLENGIFLLERNKKIRFFAKEFLPDKGVFFESRYFEKGKIKDNFFYCKKKRIQLLVCEDLWQEPLYKKPDLLISVNASPYSTYKQSLRLKRLRVLSKKTKQGVIYLNLVGSQDSLIFDGASFFLNEKGEKLWQGNFFQPDFKVLSIPFKKEKVIKTLNLNSQRKQALILGMQEFFYQTNFSKACIGLSGGIDSALVAYLAVQALGPENVRAYFLPTRYTRPISFQIVKNLSQNLKLKVIEKNIDSFFHACLRFIFSKRKVKALTQQNLQSRLRMLFLMAQSNEHSCLLLGTGNKSELAMGYSTLYGDLSGALCPIGDLLKTEVYELVNFINQENVIFPKKLIFREPSAELRYNQIDSKELAPYKDLDSFLRSFFKTRDSKKTDWVKKIHAQEFKRKQAPPILKITEQDLGESWRYPIANRFPLYKIEK
ncbi:MAG: NAD(+) synthase [Bdellovibrionales bacterium]|nr:NAD(+) synthase [Bdellovibrionales bacterium]